MTSRILLIPAILMLLCSGTPSESELRVMTSVMTYNIHLENCDMQPLPWDERKAMVAQVIHSRAPEILGLQGATLGQTDWLNHALKEYEYYAPSATTLQMGTDMCPILYSRKSYEALDQGTFLIGEAVTRAEDGSAEHPSQFLNWIKLRHLTSQKELYVLNTKIDLEAGADRLEITQRMEETITELTNGETFILLADLAHNPESDVIKEISQWANDSESNSLVSISEMEITRPGWQKQKKQVGERVDYVFLSFDIPANSYEVLDTAYDGAYPSDHLPVFCRLRIQ